MNNRENLLHQALTLFAVRGYDAVGVQEIVNAAGIQKPTLYHYFGNKQGLLTTLLTESFAPFFEELEKTASYQGDVTLTLRAVVQTYFTFASRNPLLYRFYLSTWFSPIDSDTFKFSAALNERQQSLMEALFTEAANHHGNMRGRQRAYAATFLGMINTYTTLSLNGYAEFNDQLIQTMLHQFMHGIFS